MRRALIVFMLLGLVSLFADITYEGATSIRGGYLYLIGATAVVAGFVRVGEIVNYFTRFLSGLLGDYFKSSKTLWGLVIIGYAINVVAIPLLAFARRWEEVLALVILERMGKGLRAPARDVILSEVSEEMGKGLGFGIHEFLDQFGAFSGPLIASIILLKTGGDYGSAFIALGFPGLVAVGFAISSMILYPNLKTFNLSKRSVGIRGLGKTFYIYLAGLMIMSVGFLSWDLFTFSIKSEGIVGDEIIPLFYTVAMLIDGLVAIPIGILYDKIGVSSIISAPVALIVSTLFLSPRAELLFVYSAIWGFVIGVFETNVRVAVSDIVNPVQRSLAYGVLGLFYGFSLMIGGLIQGAVYSWGFSYLKALIVVSETISIVIFSYLAYSLLRKQ
ncbi:MAG: MFS transporter [Thermosphaera sp.]